MPSHICSKLLTAFLKYLVHNVMYWNNQHHNSYTHTTPILTALPFSFHQHTVNSTFPHSFRFINRFILLVLILKRKHTSDTSLSQAYLPWRDLRGASQSPLCAGRRFPSICATASSQIRAFSLDWLRRRRNPSDPGLNCRAAFPPELALCVENPSRWPPLAPKRNTASCRGFDATPSAPRSLILDLRRSP